MAEPLPPVLKDHHGYRSWTTQFYGPDRTPDGKLRRHCVRFGREGEVSKRQAIAAFDRWKNEVWKPEAERDGQPAPYSVADLCRDYLDVAERIYVKDGLPTSEISIVRAAVGRLAKAHGAVPADEFHGPMLAQFRETLAVAKDGKKRLTAETAAHYFGVILRMFRWARGQGHISRVTLADLVEVDGPAVARTEVRAKDPIRPVEWDAVEATVKKLPKVVGDMVLLQWHTGMRPGEVRRVRPIDIDRGRGVWVYTPHTHKTEHKGKSRRIAIGPEGQKVLAPYLTGRKLDAYCFKPDAWGGNRYDLFGMNQYAMYIRRACVKAEVGHWHPNQLRHSWATRVAEEFGIEHAADGLGHASVNMAMVYAERSLKRAMEVASKVG